LFGEHVIAAWSGMDLDRTDGLLVLTRAASGLMRGIWIYSGIDGEGALIANPRTTTSNFEGSYTASFTDANGVLRDTGEVTIGKKGDGYRFNWSGAVNFIGVATEIQNLLGADDDGEWLAVAFTREDAKGPVTLADYEYRLDAMSGRTIPSDSLRLVNENLMRDPSPLSY
jgi:hypothetical protein